MKINVTYMSGAGNLFTVIDNRDYGLNTEEFEKLAPVLCRKNIYHDRRTEGLLTISRGIEDSDFEVKFFNPDGSHGAMCGNGGRCAAMFAINHGFIDDNKKNEPMEFKMAGNFYTAVKEDDFIKLYLPPPEHINKDIVINTGIGQIPAGFADVGSDHVVINKNNVPLLQNTELDKVNMATFAKPIRNHLDFEPDGVNVNLYEYHADENVIYLRTFERGVEAETGACGTGAVSTALISSMHGEAKLPVKIVPTSKIPVYVDIEGPSTGDIQQIILKGPAEVTGHGIIDLPNII